MSLSEKSPTSVGTDPAGPLAAPLVVDATQPAPEMPVGAKPHATATALEIVPILPVRNTVVFPHAVMPLTVGRDKSKRLLQESLPQTKIIGIVSQRQGDHEDPGPDDLHRVGTLATVLKLLRMADGSQTVVIQGISRLRIREFVSTEPFLTARVEKLADTDPDSPQAAVETEASALTLRTNAKEFIRRAESIPDETALMLDTIEAPGGMSDFLAANLDLNLEQKQTLLETLSVRERLRQLSEIIARRLDMLQLSQKIHEQVRAGIDKTQREYYLREQLKAIQEELGQSDERTAEVAELRKALNAAGIPAEVLKEAERELARLARIPQASPEYSVARTYLELMAELPWAKSTKDRLDIRRAARILDEDHFDLEKVKKRILEYLAVRKLKADGKGPILCLVGPPGVGKTSLGKSVARALGRSFIRLALGGMHDESEIRGHRRTYIGSMPGRILQELRKAATNNPVMMLDEIDKLGKDWRGDPASALLEVLDPAQNNTFTDHYLDAPFDLSRVMFIATANLADPIPAPLADRMEFIEIAGYTEEQKLHIARRYLLPRQVNDNGLSRGQLRIEDAVILDMIRRWTREAGVRGLERHLGAVCRSVAARVAAREVKSATITTDALTTILGSATHEGEVRDRTGFPGVVTGLAWTPFGGDILFIETTAMTGKGGVMLTGQLGEVMKESAQAALSYLRSRAADLGVSAERLAKTDVHIHVPAGATPKDGPSAGVAMLTSLVSLMTGQPVRGDLAMTGEITLRGLVLPIGGVKEKALAAHRVGIREVILPARNAKDLIDVPESVRQSIVFHFVDRVEDVLRLALPTVKITSASAQPSVMRPAKASTPAKSPPPPVAGAGRRGKSSGLSRRRRRPA